jgi:hypothetical protein
MGSYQKNLVYPGEALFLLVSVPFPLNSKFLPLSGGARCRALAGREWLVLSWRGGGSRS